MTSTFDPVLLAEQRAASGAAGFLRSFPMRVWIVAVLAAMLHAAPYVLATRNAPPGWRFSGILSDSVDYVQYRAWMRHSQATGPIVDDTLTSEANRPHLPVTFYWLSGKLGAWLNTDPELVYGYAGVPLAFGFSLLLYGTIRRFIPAGRQAWWVFVAIMAGGGFGAHIKLLLRFEQLRQNFLVRTLLTDALWGNDQVLLFEDYRGHYVFSTLFDSHFLLVWLLATAAILAMHLAIEKPSVGRILAVIGLYTLITFLHIHEAVVLTAISGATALMLWRKNLLTRARLATLVVGPVFAMSCLVALFVLQKSSGIVFPPWRSLNIPAAVLFVAYPVAWIVISCGLAAYWKNAGLRECLLMGWALGCTVVTLSGPFYAFPDRGTLSLQIPIYAIAGTIFFAWFDRARTSFRFASVAACLFLLAATPAWTLIKAWGNSQFDPTSPHVFEGPSQRAISDVLRQNAARADVLLAKPADVLWLSAVHPGRHYSAHFFLTVDYERKRVEVEKFFASSLEEQAAFLREKGIRFVYVSAGDSPERFRQVPGLMELRSEEIGSLYAFDVQTANVHGGSR